MCTTRSRPGIVAVWRFGVSNVAVWRSGVCRTWVSVLSTKMSTVSVGPDSAQRNHACSGYEPFRISDFGYRLQGFGYNVGPHSTHRHHACPDHHAFRFSGVSYRTSCTGFRVQSRPGKRPEGPCPLRMLGLGFRDSGTGVEGLPARTTTVSDSGNRVSDIGYSVQGFELRVSCFRYRV